MLANDLSYRPTVLDAGRHLNRRGKAHYFGQSLASNHYRLIHVYDGVATWMQHGETQEVLPAHWTLIPPNEDLESLYVSSGCRWAEIRFTAIPSAEIDPDIMSIWAVALPQVMALNSGTDEELRLTAAYEDILSWWWRDPWLQLRLIPAWLLYWLN